MNREETYYHIALLEVDGIGPTLARQMINHLGSAKNVFEESTATLSKIKLVGNKLAAAVSKGDIFRVAEEELAFCEKNNIEVLSYKGDRFPKRLNHCQDAPSLLYYQGNSDLNQSKIVSIVGTRNATSYGKSVCTEIIESLRDQDVLVVSGLAYGIDIHAHQTALDHQLNTVGVLAHGLDRIYPKAHTATANQMVRQGGLLTENKINTRPDRENFPKRNRIVAGMCDATIVIESAIKGGSMITANLANSYSRDVFAVPGRNNDPLSEGCNHLIKTNQAHLLSSPNDIGYLLGWEKSSCQPRVVQKEMFIDLNPEEEVIVSNLDNSESTSIDELANRIKLPISKVATQLLMLELRGIIKQLPGKKYQLT